MTLVRYPPLDGLLSFCDVMNGTFEDFLSRPNAGREAGQEMTLYPAVDLVEEGDQYTITAELPGFKAEDVKITLAQNVLTIEGEKKADHEQRQRSYHHVERSYGCFHRSFALSGEVQSDNVKAAARDGVLTVTIPKAELAKAREIRVETA